MQSMLAPAWAWQPANLHMVDITAQPIDTESLLREVASHKAGAVVLFLGTTRALTDGRRTVSLDYECHVEMARDKLAELETEARRRWPLVACAIVHRIGHVPLGEASVAVAVSTPHRNDAFCAGQWLIDTLKEVVPIWKKENWADGTSQWIHPGLNAPPEAASGENRCA
jgi:molybdopterin synthase catalytic subunit